MGKTGRHGWGIREFRGHEQGRRVKLADCDTQQSSSEWIREAAPDVKAVRLDNLDIILNELPLLQADADYMIADGPGSKTETSPGKLVVDEVRNSG